MDSSEDTKVDNTIYIYDPKDIPFGKLSNNAVFPMFLDEKHWNTITNYIFSNMLTTPIYRAMLRVAPIDGDKKNTNVDDRFKQLKANMEARGNRMSKYEEEQLRDNVLKDLELQKKNIYDLYDYYSNEEYVETITTALDKAYSVKIESDPELKTILLSTGNSPIMYESRNAILGTGNGSGKNLIGKTLMQIRQQLNYKPVSEDKNINTIFVIYQAIIILRKLLFEKHNILTDYEGKTAQEIVDSNKALANSIPIDTPANMKVKYPEINDELQHPGNIANLLRNKYKDKIKEIVEAKKKNEMCREFIKYTIELQNPNMPSDTIEQAVDQFIFTIPGETQSQRLEQYKVFCDNVIKSYYQNKLPSELTDRITQIVEIYGNIEAIQSNKYSSSSSSSSSSDEDNPIKKVLSDNFNSRKETIIKQIQAYTGLDKKRYQKYSMEELEEKLREYDQGEREIKASGKWIVQVKHTNNKIEILKESDDKPSNSDIIDLVSKYNKSSKRTIKTSQVRVYWKGSKQEKVEDSKAIETDSDSVPSGFIKNSGDPVVFTPTDKTAILYPFSPLFAKSFTVNGFTFPNVSIYTTVMLITKTGTKKDARKLPIYFKGTSINTAISMVQKISGDWMNPDEANAVYQKYNIRATKELLKTFATFALRKKFEYSEMKNMLLDTGDAHLIWKDYHDSYLGYDRKDEKGGNVVGQILMDIRNELLQKSADFKPVDVSKILEFIIDDAFILGWVEMRLKDICSTIYSSKQYIELINSTSQDIDDRFVRIIIRSLYQNCGGIAEYSDKVKSDPPEIFLGLVKECRGMPVIGDALLQEIDRIRGEMRDAELTFRGIKTIDDIKVVEDFDKLLARFKGSSKLNDKDVELFIKQHFVGNEQQAEHYLFEKNQREEWDTQVKKIVQSDLSVKQINEELEKLREKQDREWYKYFNLDYVLAIPKNANKREKYYNEKEKEERKHLEYIESMRKDLNKTKIALATETKKINSITQQITNEYWKYIVGMISFLVSNLNNPTDHDIRRVIMSTQKVISDEHECEKVGEDLEPLETCIVSAINNILVAIKIIKNEYCENKAFATYDLDFAKAIILGTGLSDTEFKIAYIMNDEKPAIEIVDESDVEENEDNAGEEVIIVSDDYEANEDEEPDHAEFGMNSGTTNKYQTIVREMITDPNVDIEKMADHLEIVVDDIKHDKTNKNKKLNRINFFATLLS